MSKDLVQFKLMVQKNLRHMIEVEAKKRGRSANREAVERIEISFVNYQKPRYRVKMGRA